MKGSKKGSLIKSKGGCSLHTHDEDYILVLRGPIYQEYQRGHLTRERSTLASLNTVIERDQFINVYSWSDS